MTARRKVVTALAILSPLCLVLALMLRPRTARELVPAAGFSGSSSSGAGVAHEIASLQAALDRKPKHVPILLRMAELERSEGRLTEAVAHLREAVKAEPGSVDANLELGRALFETGDAAGALSATKRVLEEDRNQVDALYNLGAIYANLGNDAWARTYFGRAVEAGPSTESGRKAKAALLQLPAANRRTDPGPRSSRKVSRRSVQNRGPAVQPFPFLFKGLARKFRSNTPFTIENAEFT